MKKRILVEFGMGTSLRRRDYTEAACRAVRDALWHHSINAAELFGFEKEAMILDVAVGVAEPERVDTDKVAAMFPYGQPSVTVSKGGLDVPRADGGQPTVIANVAITVSFDMEKVAA